MNFNKEIDDTTTTTSTVKLYVDGSATELAGTTVAVSEDKKSVVVVNPGTFTQSASVKVVLDGIKDADGNELGKYETTLTVKDVIDPVAQSIEIINN